MADETPKPKRKRRRWVIAGVLLFAVVGWWNWPRGDARFVGKWAVSRTSQGKTIHIFQMSVNGGGWAQHVASGNVTLLNWRAEGNTLTLGYRWHRAGDLLSRFRQWLHSVTGWHLWIISADDLEIVEITANTIVLRPVLPPVGSTETLTLTRVPE